MHRRVTGIVVPACVALASFDFGKMDSLNGSSRASAPRYLPKYESRINLALPVRF